jgi:hypothetical protein
VGWHPFVLDTNGNGKLDEFAEPASRRPGKDMRINPGLRPLCGDAASEGRLGLVHVGVFGGRPGFLRFDPKTKLSEFYAVPKEAIGLRGGDIDSDGGCGPRVQRVI